jgi:uncharacterized membrane protein YuzA (DUF378 family)
MHKHDDEFKPTRLSRMDLIIFVLVGVAAVVLITVVATSFPQGNVFSNIVHTM